MDSTIRLLRVVFVVLGLAIVVHGCTTERQAGKADSAPDGKQSLGTQAANVPKAGKPFYRPAGTGPAVWGPGDLYTFLATGDETNGAYFQFEALVPEGGDPPAHVHHGEDETFYLVQGKLEMRLGDEIIPAKAGDFVNIPRGTVHRFKNVGNESAILVVTFVPAGMEKYFEEVFPSVEDRTATPPPITKELIERMTAAGPRYRLEILPPAESERR